MALIPATLHTGLLRMFRLNAAANGAQGASDFARAYFAYAAPAMSAYGPFIPTGTEQLRLESILRASILPIGAPLLIAQAWGSGLQAFWTGAVFGTGAATALPGAAAVVGALNGVLSSNRNTAEVAAARMASAIDIATRTLVIGGPGGPVPVF